MTPTRTVFAFLVVSSAAILLSGCYTQVGSTRPEPAIGQDDSYSEGVDSSGEYPPEDYTEQDYNYDRDRLYYDYYYPSTFVNVPSPFALGSYGWYGSPYNPFWCGTSYPTILFGWPGYYPPWSWYSLYYPSWWYSPVYYGGGGYAYGYSDTRGHGDRRTIGSTRGRSESGGVIGSGRGGTTTLPTATVTRGGGSSTSSTPSSGTSGPAVGREGSTGRTRSGSSGAVNNGGRSSRGGSRESTTRGGSRRGSPETRSAPPERVSPPQRSAPPRSSGGESTYSPPPSRPAPSAPPQSSGGSGGTRSGGGSRDSGPRR